MAAELNRFTKKVILCSIFFLTFGAFFSFGQDTSIQKVREHYRLGQIYYEHGLYDQAEDEFEKALEASKKPALEAIVQEKKTVSKVGPPKGIRYTISPGDTLFISIWENRDLSQEVIVRPDGKISFPLIEEVPAQGLSIEELDRVLTEALKEFIRYPDVSVSLRKMGGEKIIVLGEVKDPGVYSIKERKSVLEAIALAGGYTEHAVLRSVIVITGGFENPKAKRLNLAKALHKGKFEEDIGLLSQDIVFVPKRFIADVNYYIRQIVGPISGATPAKETGRAGW